jgi:Homeodomain-like domain
MTQAHTRKEWFYRYSSRNGGDLADERVHDQVLDLWASGKTKREICETLNIHVSTVRMATIRARHQGDERAFTKTKPIFRTTGAICSVLDIHREQWFIRGMSEATGIHFTQLESMMRKLVAEIKEKT